MNRRNFSKTIILYLYIVLTISLFFIFSCDSKLVDTDFNLPPFDLNLSVEAEGRILLSWEYSASSSDTVLYYIARKAGTSDWDEYYMITEDKEFIDVIPTNSNIVYSYYVSAYNYSTGSQSSISDIIAYFSEYSYPTDILIEQTAQDQVVVSWTDNSIGEEGFYIDRKLGEASWANKYRVLGGNTTAFEDITTLYEEVTYRVYAFSGITTTPTLIDTILPTLLAPSNVVLEKPDNQQIRISWQSNSETEEGFYIDKKIGELDWIIDYVYVDNTVNTYIDDIDLPCGSFTYRVRAVDGIYSSPFSDEAEIDIYLNLISASSTSGEAAEVFISEETNWYAVIADNFYGIALIDCVNPSAPQVQNYNEEGIPDRTLAVHVRDNLAYITANTGLNAQGRLFVIDFTEIMPYHGIEFPSVLAINAIVPVSNDPDDTYIPYDIYIEGDYAYIANGENGLEILNIATATPYHVGNYPTGGVARKVYVDNSLAYVSTGLNGVVVVDVSTPTNPTQTDHFTTTGFSLDAVEKDGYLYIADGENGLKIVNLSTDQESYVPTGGFANSLYVQGHDRLQEDHVYLTDKEQGLYVIDITDTENPYILGNYEMDSEPVSISKFFQSSYVFIADNDGLKIVQIAP